MKIAVLSPAYPYRGGIAHHTNMMVRTLRKRGHTVDVYTFSRQYPAFLYPGAFQEEESPEFADIGSHRTIDSMNPLTWLSTARKIQNGGYDVYLTRFWIPLFGLQYAMIAKRLHGGSAKGRVLTVVDNLVPHEPRPGDRFLTDLQFRYCNGAITQSGTVEQQLAERYPELPQKMLPHPVYENFGETIDRREARELLGIDPEKPTLMFFGFIREYKGLDLLLEAMPEILRRVPNAELLVVGESFGGMESFHSQIDRLGIGEHVRLHTEYVANEEVSRWFSAADLLVLPYRSATNSGIVQIGYNFATPSVVTNVGSLAEVVIDGKTGFVVDAPTPEALGSAVAMAFEDGRLEQMKDAIIEERKKYSWDAFVAGIEQFAEEQFGC